MAECLRDHHLTPRPFGHRQVQLNAISSLSKMGDWVQLRYERESRTDVGALSPADLEVASARSSCTLRCRPWRRPRWPFAHRFTSSWDRSP